MSVQSASDDQTLDDPGAPGIEFSRTKEPGLAAHRDDPQCALRMTWVGGVRAHVRGMPMEPREHSVPHYVILAVVGQWAMHHRFLLRGLLIVALTGHALMTGATSPATVDAVIRGASADPNELSGLLPALAQAGRRGHAKLCELLTDPRSDVSVRAAQTLLEVGPRAADVVDCVIAHLATLPPATLDNTLGYLSQLPLLPAAASPVLRQLASHPDEHVARAVAFARQRFFPLETDGTIRKWTPEGGAHELADTVLMLGVRDNSPTSARFLASDETLTPDARRLRIERGLRGFVFGSMGEVPAVVTTVASGPVGAIISVATENELPRYGQLLFTSRPLPPQHWRSLPGKDADRKRARALYLRRAGEAYRLPHAGQDASDWICTWFKPGVTRAPDDFTFFRLATPRSSALLITAPDCLVGEYLIGTLYLEPGTAHTPASVAEGEGSASPLVDIDGDGFPEFLGATPSGGTWLPTLFSLLPRYRVLYATP